MKKIEMYECSHCEHTLKTEKGILAHEIKCEKNPKVILKERLKGQDAQDVEYIRNNAKSLDDIIRMTTEFLAKRDIDITFNSFPTKYSKMVSNSHNSPRGKPQNWCGRGDKDGIPKGYPGWTGRWNGTIVNNGVYKDGKEISLGDLNDHWDKLGFRLDFIQTGTGGPGVNFSIEGILFVEDFPLIFAEMEGDLVSDDYSEKFNEGLGSLVKEYEGMISTHCAEDDFMIRLKDTRKQLSVGLASIDEAIKLHRNEMSTMYKNDNPIPLPEVETSLIDLSKYYSLKEQYKEVPHNAADFTDEFNELLAKLQKTVDNFTEIIEERPSIFL